MAKQVFQNAKLQNQGLHIGLPQVENVIHFRRLIASRTPVIPNNTGDQNGRQGDTDRESGVDTIDKVDFPKMYRVVLLNDDFTPMDFVVLVLRRFFAKTEEQATQIMLDVHKKGAGVAGVFTLEIAEMKAMQVNQLSRANQHPLKCNIEPESQT